MCETRMKIAIISRGWWPTIKGGSEKFISKVAEELHNRGHEVIGITRQIHGFPRPEAPHKLIIAKESKAIPLISSFRFSRWASKVANELDVDIVLVNSYWGEMAPIFIKKSSVAIIHDIGLFSSSVSDSWWKNKLRSFVLKEVTKRVKAIIVPTEMVKKDIIKYLKAKESKIRVIGFEGVDGPFRKVHVENEWFDIVQVARFAPNKGQHILLKAFKIIASKIPNARLWLVGGRSPGHLDYLNKILREVNEIKRQIGEDRVKVIVDAPTTDPYYAVADVCVFPSLGEEGFGLTILECMSYGKPVICSDIFIETGVASHEEVLIMPRGDVRALTELIIKLYRNLDLRRTLSEKGLEHSKKYRWSDVAERIEEILLELINQL